MRQRDFIRLFEPAELAQVFHASCFEREHDFCKVQPFDFRQLMRRALVVLLLRPQPDAGPRCGTAGATGPLVKSAAAVKELVTVINV